MTPAVQLGPCLTNSDSLLRFLDYSAVLLGAQALWWDGATACAAIGSKKFGIVSGINQRVAQWAEPLFMRSGQALPSGHWLRDDGEHLSSADQARDNKPETLVSRVFRRLGLPATQLLPVHLPPLRGANNSLVKAVRPGGDSAAIIQLMDPELIIVQFRNMTAGNDTNAGRCKGSELVHGCMTLTTSSGCYRRSSAQRRAGLRSASST